MSALSPFFAQKLQRRRPLAMDPARAIAIKRNLHEWVVAADADRFARTFAEVMAEPGARFGAITVKRLPGREGQPFRVGERFTGCVNLPHVPGWLADSVFSDFAEVMEVQPRRVVYRYLSGCPMAGTSTFEVRPVTSVSCSLRIIFEYQERGGLGVSVLHRFGLRLHDQVSRAQVERTAERLGAAILSTTLPAFPLE
jgi:hypothetical protein